MATDLFVQGENMKSKIKTILLTILIFSFVEFIVYGAYSLWDINDGVSGNRNLTEQEISDLSISLNNYFHTQENIPERWEIRYSYFAKAILDNPVPNQYIVCTDCYYEDGKKCYGFSMLKGLKNYYIDTVEEYYVPPEGN